MTASTPDYPNWTPFVGDRVSSPGETLRETLEALPMSQSELAVRTGLTTKHINQLVSRNASLTHETAIKLERATGVSARMWNSLESNYRDHLAREGERESLSVNHDWLKGLPLAELRKRGHVSATMHDPGRVLQEVLAFFRVSDTAAWKAAWEEPSVAFLQSAAFEAQPGAVAAWLRFGEIAAKDLATAPYDRNALRDLIPDLRGLTLLPPQEFWPKVQSMCASVGVAVVLVPSVKGAHASGATRWLSPSKALVQLSARYKRNDHFWFALFHELAHVLLHGKKDVFVEANLGEHNGQPQARADDEHEANEFAVRTLIPSNYNEDLSRVMSPADAVALAARIGTHPGIIAGRIQHDRQLYTFGVPKLFVSLEIVDGE